VKPRTQLACRACSKARKGIASSKASKAIAWARLKNGRIGSMSVSAMRKRGVEGLSELAMILPGLFVDYGLIIAQLISPPKGSKTRGKGCELDCFSFLECIPKNRNQKQRSWT
jgi:hypothetical protein